MCVASEVSVGTIAIVKVGRNEVEVEVIAILPHGWRVKSRTSGREFEVSQIDRLVTEAAAPDAPAEDSAEAAPETTAEEAPNPAPEAATPARPEKKLSLLNAAAKVLSESSVPMNCKEMVAKAKELNLWDSPDAKTPEQTLYSGIFREMKTHEKPRFKKSETKKGSFEFVKEE